jgi:hypothetical protein
VPAPPAPSWSDDDATAAEAAGRQAWRAPGRDGFSCAHCHAPEPLEFAVTALSDEAFLTHARRMGSEATAQASLGLVYVLRRRHGLTRVCGWPWRPFQPGGGEVLSSEGAFASQLAQRGLRVTQVVTTAEDARALWDELAALDLTTVPLPLALPPLSAAASLDDWMTHGPVVGRDAELFSRHDALLAERSDAAADALRSFLVAEASPAGSFPAPAGVAAAWVRGLNVEKHAATVGLFLELSRAVRAASSPGPVPPHERALALLQSADPCAGDDACSLTSLPRLPGGQAVDHTMRDSVETVAQALSRSWWALAWAKDPSLLATLERPAAPGTHFMQGWATDPAQRKLTRPFMHAVRLARQRARLAPLFSGGDAPDVSVRLPPAEVRTPWLDGLWAMFPGWTAAALEGDEVARAGLVLRLNVLRAVLLEQQQALRAGAPVADRFTLQVTLVRFEGLVRDVTEAHRQRLQRGEASFNSEQAAVLLDDTARLLGDVSQSVSSAPEVVVPRAPELLDP